MSWASAYEPMQSTQPMPPSMNPNMMSSGGYGGQGPIGEPQQLPSMMAHQMAARPPVAGDKNVPIPKKPAQPSPWKDISEDDNIYDWFYIVVAIIVVEAIGITLFRFFPEFFGKFINIWYNRFKLSAVAADILIVLIGFGITRYIYSEWAYDKYGWNPLYFTGMAVAVQVIHDILFYIGVIRNLQPGQNSMIDLFKEYSSAGGLKVVAADSAMMIATSLGAMLLKSASGPLVIFIGLLGAYTIPYVLETRNNYSNIA